jgi:hypothetical protein
MWDGDQNRSHFPFGQKPTPVSSNSSNAMPPGLTGAPLDPDPHRSFRMPAGIAPSAARPNRARPPMPDCPPPGHCWPFPWVGHAPTYPGSGFRASGRGSALRGQYVATWPR